MTTRRSFAKPLIVTTLQQRESNVYRRTQNEGPASISSIYEC